MRVTLRHLLPMARMASMSRRRGVFLVMAALTLAIVMTFVAFSVDTGIISLTRTRMQNGTDTAALAAAMEISHAIANSDESVEDVFEYAKQQATAKAVEVAEMNGIFVDPASDVVFGRCSVTANGGREYVWNPPGHQINCVKVIARRDNPDESAPDGRVPGLFTGMFRDTGATLKTESIAFIEPRDIVVVHDFSRSMNFDSYYCTEGSTQLPTATIDANIQMVWEDLQPLNLGTLPYEPAFAWQTKATSGASCTVTFRGDNVQLSSNTGIKEVVLYMTGSRTQTFTISNNTTTSGTWQGTGTNAGRRIVSLDVKILRVGSTSNTWTHTGYECTTSVVRSCFGLNNISFPYPGGSWSDFVTYVQGGGNSGSLTTYGYRDKFGGKTFLCYLMQRIPSYHQCQDLWKTRAYPFHAIKEGHILLCDFLEELSFDDYVGMVSYDTNHRIETSTNQGNPEIPYVNIAGNPLTNNYEVMRKLMKYKQAAHYSFATNMSGGMKSALALLDQHKRPGSRPAILLMTDGNSNTLDAGENGNLPAGWNWNELFDYNGNGSANFSTNDVQRRAVLKYVKEAVDKGYIVHAMCVGADGDQQLMQAVAWLGNGHYINVPGGVSIADMEAQLRAAFIKIAAAVPPARLVNSEE